MDSAKVKDFLLKLNISFIQHEHPPVYTVEEAKKYRNGIAGIHCRNLFLEDSKRRNLFLLTVEADTPVRLNAIRKLLKAKKLSFASADKLKEYLGLEPGAVSPFGLINDERNLVIYLIEKNVWEYNGNVNFHPNINSKTLSLKKEDFHKFIEHVGNTLEIIDLTKLD